MKKTLPIFLCLFLSLFISSCDEDDGCTPLIIPITNLEAEYNCVNTAYQMNIALIEDFIIIRSQFEFNNLITGSCMPDIDFTTFDLLIGKKALNSGIDAIDYDGLLRNCDDGQLYLTITFIKNDTDEAPNLTYHALVPKQDEDVIINVSIVTIN